MSKSPNFTVIGVAAVAVGGFVVYRLFQNAADNDPYLGLVESVDLNSLTYPVNVYDNIADDIQSQIWGSALGLFEDEQGVIASMQMLQNIDDLYFLIGVYGRRSDQGVNGFPDWFPPFYAKMSLIQTISRYLSLSDIAEINDYFASVGIDFEFIAQ